MTANGDRAGSKLIMVMIDSLATETLERAIAADQVPALKEICERGTLIRDCVSTFPSLTPVASATLATGRGPADHHVPSMNWFSRGERRYVEYGSSWQATRKFGVVRTLLDTVYNMNLEHLSQATPTLFERIEDAGYRAACTPFLIYRGRHRHRVALDGVMKRVADVATFDQATYGPSEFFYGGLFQSRVTPCVSLSTRPGNRDEFTACVGSYLAENDLFDFMLFSLPDHDFHGHRFGPETRVRSITSVDEKIAKLIDAAGGSERFFERYAVVVVGDHSQSAVRKRASLFDALSDWRILNPGEGSSKRADLAVSPGSRSGMIYLLDETSGDRSQELVAVADRLTGSDGVELVIWQERSAAGVVACVRGSGGELRFKPGSAIADLRGGAWDLTGSEEALDLKIEAGAVTSTTYPNVLGRIWSALNCPTAGDILLSAEPGFEFVDWGGSDHVGGGSHGSLRAEDSIVPLICVGCGPSSADERPMWTIEDVSGIVLDHFGLR